MQTFHASTAIRLQRSHRFILSLKIDIISCLKSDLMSAIFWNMQFFHVIKYDLKGH